MSKKPEAAQANPAPAGQDAQKPEGAAPEEKRTRVRKDYSIPDGIKSFSVSRAPSGYVEIAVSTTAGGRRDFIDKQIPNRERLIDLAEITLATTGEPAAAVRAAA